MSAAGVSIRSWSTLDVPKAMRFDYWMSVMRTALWPVTEYGRYPHDFPVQLQEAQLGTLSTCEETIGPHVARRTRVDVARTRGRSYHLFVSFDFDWSVIQSGRNEQLRRGDVILLGEGEHETCVPSGFHGVILKCPVAWVQTWLPSPDLLVGRRIARESRWGQVLSPIAGQLTPALAATPPLPHQVLTDQLGAVLALAAGELEQRSMPQLRARIRDCIRERCVEPQLTASEVAVALGISTRALHRLIAGRQRTFAMELLDARVEVALSLLRSRRRAAMSIAKIAQRAGFQSVGHFTRVILGRTGRTPMQWRPAPSTTH